MLETPLSCAKVPFGMDIPPTVCFAEFFRIGQAQRDIEELKVQLEEAKIERQHKEECEAIRKLIAAQSPRLATQKQLNELEKELVQLEAENFAAHRTIELRKKQFSLLLHVVSNFKSSHEFDVTKLLVLPVLFKFGNVFSFLISNEVQCLLHVNIFTFEEVPALLFAL